MVDDISRYGGVRTRVTEELGCLSGNSNTRASIIWRCNLSNIEAIGPAIATVRKESGLATLSGFAYPKVPHGGIPFLHEISFLVNSLFLAILILPKMLASRIDLIYGHNNELGSLAIVMGKIFGVPTVVDLHGVEVDEHLASHPRLRGQPGRIKFWRRVERFVLHGAGTVVCVSKAHLAETRSRAGRDLRIHVLPCFADERVFDCDDRYRSEMRRSLGFSDDEVVLVYSGLIPEKLDEANPLSFFEKLRDAPSVRLAILAADPESVARARSRVPEAIRDRVLVASVPRPMVARYLCACDLAILLRSPSIVHRVASPTKFAEYLLCGLPVLISDGIGDSTALVREHGIGLVASEVGSNGRALTDAIRGVACEEVRRRARQVGVSTLSRGACSRIFTGILDEAFAFPLR